MSEQDIHKDTYIYHEVKAPKGVIVSASEASKLYKKGWVDTPAKFGIGTILGIIGFYLRRM